MDSFRIDEIARRLLESVPPALRTMQKDLETNFRAVLRSSLAKLDVVTRDEFDTQTRVLQRTREKLEQLEARLRDLEAKRSGGEPAGTTGGGAGGPAGATNAGPGGTGGGGGVMGAAGAGPGATGRSAH
jgi:ubiquinone biosynthesis accessory factor UbiK